MFSEVDCFCVTTCQLWFLSHFEFNNLASVFMKGTHFIGKGNPWIVSLVGSWSGRPPGKPWKHVTWYSPSERQKPFLFLCMIVSFADCVCYFWNTRPVKLRETENTVVEPCRGARVQSCSPLLWPHRRCPNFQHFASFCTPHAGLVEPNVCPCLRCSLSRD